MGEGLQNIRASHLKLVKSYRLILDDINFTLHAGEGLLLKGHNGAGKSTLLRVLAGLLRLGMGSLTYNDGHDVYKESEGYLSHVAYLGHQNALKKELTVAENMCSLGIERRKLETALALFGMEDMIDYRTRHFSAGQQRRVALSRVIASQRALWLLDEPLTGLDVASRESLEQAMFEHQKRGGMIVLSSHDPVDMTNCSLLELCEGRVRQLRQSNERVSW